MDEMAEYYDDRFGYASDDDERYQKQVKTCRYCGQGGLHWALSRTTKWALYNNKNEYHQCARFKHTKPTSTKEKPIVNYANTPVKHMETSHLINLCAWLWRVMMHKRLQLMATKYAEGPNGEVDASRVVKYDQRFMDQFNMKDAEAKIDEMTKEINRRQRAR